MKWLRYKLGLQNYWFYIFVGTNEDGETVVSNASIKIRSAYFDFEIIKRNLPEGAAVLSFFPISKSEFDAHGKISHTSEDLKLNLLK